MNNRQVQEHGITVIGSTSSDAGATAAITDPSSAVSGGSGGSTGVGGNHDNDDNHHHQQQQVQLPFEELVQCIRSVPIRVVNVHFCAHGGGREGGENPQERKDVFTDLLSKEAKTTTKIHTGTFGGTTCLIFGCGFALVFRLSRCPHKNLAKSPMHVCRKLQEVRQKIASRYKTSRYNVDR